MCKVADAAKIMVNLAIDQVTKTGNENYYADFYKLHKLLFYSQWYMLSKNHIQLFDDEIEAHTCGPFIPKLLELDMGGYGPIQTKYDESEYFPITIDRIQAMEFIITEFGKKTKDELVSASKKSKLYTDFYSKEKNRIIPKADMEETEFIFPNI